METDNIFVAKALSGDDQAFTLLVERHLTAVWVFVFQLVRNRDVADDLTQDTWLKTWKALRRFDQKRSFRTWLFTIAHNTVVDYFKKHREIPFVALENEQDEYTFAETIADSEILPDEWLVRADVAQEIDRILSLLSPLLREVLILRFREDLSLQEIATILEEPYNTVKSRYQRAIKSFRQAISANHAPLKSLSS